MLSRDWSSDVCSSERRRRPECGASVVQCDDGGNIRPDLLRDHLSHHRVAQRPEYPLGRSDGPDLRQGGPAQRRTDLANQRDVPRAVPTLEPTAGSLEGDHSADRALYRNQGRSEERRVGKECVSTCRTRWSPDSKKEKHQKTTQ